MGNVRNGLVLLFFVGIIAFAKNHFGSILGVSNLAQTDNKWSLIVGGDVMLGRSVNTRSLKYKNFNFPFLKIKDYLSSADMSMVNLENPVTSKCLSTDKGMIFCAPSDSLSGLKWSGIDVVNLDNNHTLNHGNDGYEETKKYLSEYGIGYFDDQNFYTTTVKGVKIGVLGFDLVSDHRPERINEMLRMVVDRSRECELMIVNLHWGEEYLDKPSLKMKEIAKELISNGADLIVGHHSHVVGKYEEIDGVPVIYSLGNLVFDQMWSNETRVGMLIKFRFDGSSVIDKEFAPIRIFDYGQPALIEENEKSKIVEAFLRK